MNKFFFILILFFCNIKIASSQVVNADSLNKVILKENYWQIKPWIASDAAVQKSGIAFVKLNNDWKFYVVIALLTFFAIFKLLFSKYIVDLFALMFKSNLKSKQIKDQLLNTQLPSIVLNVFYTIVMGVFCYLIIQFYNPSLEKKHFIIIMLSIIAIGCVYLVKYLSLQCMGWLFGAKEVANTYIFTVFYFNKIVGILLLPVVVFLLLNTALTNTLIIISLFLFVVLLAYRYLKSYLSLQKLTQVSQFHFFLYLCTVEIMPLLLIYKGLMLNYSKLL
jgi:hypothetical protein